MIANIGGIFIYSATPAALADWYKEHLGIAWEHNPEYKAWYASFHYTEIETGKKRSTAWSILPNDTRPKFQGKVFCVNYRTNHMDTLVAHLRSKGVEVKGHEDSPPQGRFAWCEDPDGNYIELWQE